MGSSFLESLARRAPLDEGAKTLLQIVTSPSEDVEADGDAIHELHRRVWPVFEKALLRENARSTQKSELSALRVYFKTLPARIWVVQVARHGNASSNSLGLPLPCSETLIETLKVCEKKDFFFFSFFYFALLERTQCRKL